MKRFFLLAALVVTAFTAKAQQLDVLPIDEGVRIGKLENGLTYYIRHNEEPKGQAAFYIAHRVGSVQEDDNQQGLAHFLEHMAFNGSKHFPAGSVFGFIQRIGVTDFNAETGIDMTYYHLHNAPVTNPVIVDSCLLLLSDWSCQVELTQKEIDQERDVIHGEYRMRDNAQQRMLTKLLPQLYPGSKYSDRMPIGKMEIIDNFSPDFLEAYYKKWYHPSIQAVIVVGDVDVDHIEGKIKELFGPLKNPENEAPYELYPVPDNEQAIYAIESDKEQPQNTLNYYFKHAPIPMEMRGSTAFIANLFMKSIVASCLNQRLQELALKADCPFVLARVSDGQYLVSKTCDAFGLTIMPKPGKDAEATKAVMTEIARVQQHGFTAGEIQRATDEFVAGVEAIYNNRDKQPNGYWAQQYLSHFLMGDAIPNVETELQVYKMLASQLPAEVYQQYLQQLTQSTERNFVLMGMCSETDKPAAADLKQAVAEGITAQTEAYVDEDNGQPLIAELPKPVKVKKVAQAPFGYTQWQLANGANVYFKKTDFSDDEINLQAVSKGGTNLLSDDKAPLTSIFLNPQTGQRFYLLDIIAGETGIANLTGTQLKKKLAGKKVGVEISMGEHVDGLKGISTVKDMRTMFELINLRFQGASNDPDACENILSQLEMLMPQLDAMHALVQADSVQNLLFNHSPRKQFLHASTRQKVNYDMVRQAINERFQSAGDFDFIFTGAINEDSLRLYVEQYIAPLPGLKKREAKKDLGINPIKGVHESVYTCKMQNADASEVIVNVRWAFDDKYTLKDAVTAYALGSVLSDRYFRKIREDNSMGYSAGANAKVSSGFNPSYAVTASANIKPECKDQCLEIIYNEMELLAKNGVTEEELKTYKEPALTNFAQTQRDNSYWTDVLATYLLDNIDGNTGKDELIKGITSADLQKMAEKLLKSGNRVTVVMTPEL